MSDHAMKPYRPHPITTDGAEHTTESGMHVNRRGLIVAVAVAALALVAGISAVEYYSLPKPFTVESGNVLLDYTGGNKAMAIKVAERTGIPVIATELSGRPENVDYKTARRLMKQTGRYNVDARIYPGDFVDARRRIYIPASRHVATRPG